LPVAAGALFTTITRAVSVRVRLTGGKRRSLVSVVAGAPVLPPSSANPVAAIAAPSAAIARNRCENINLLVSNFGMDAERIEDDNAGELFQVYSLF
jgi:hypothetical protein